MSDLTKSQLRRTLRSARVAHPDRESASNTILTVLESQPVFQQAAVIAWYVDAGSEVITRDALRAVLEEGSDSDHKVHAVPFCDGDELVFYSLRDWSDLQPGQFGILAPGSAVRSDADRRVDPNKFDVILVPAVGFDHHGNRLGQGKGFYDRFLNHVRSDVVKIGLAFDCQVVESLPLDEHDVPVDMVITESGVRMVGS